MDLVTLLSLSLVLLLPLLSSIFFVYFRQNTKSTQLNPTTSKKPNPGSTKQSSSAAGLLQFVRNAGRILDWTTELVAASPTNTVATFAGIITANPSNIEHVLKTNFDNYPKGGRFASLLHDLFGRGIFVSDGDHWKVQRRTASLEFAARSTRALVAETPRRELAERLLPLLRRAAAGGDVLDLQDVLERFAFDNVCRISCGVDPGLLLPQDAGEGSERGGVRLARAFEEATALLVDRFKLPLPVLWKAMRLFNVGPERRLGEAISTVHEFAMEVIRSRKRQGTGPAGSDLLSRFIADNDYPDEFLRDIFVSLVVAGRDTTSATLTWFFWLVSSRPDVKRKILEEIGSVRGRRKQRQQGSIPPPPPGEGEEEEIFTLEELSRMEYLHAALSETMRLYPPVPLQSRVCCEDDVLPDGTVVGKGQTVMYNSYAMGRMEEIWGGDCEEFRPERWLADGVFQPKSPFRYPVFHAGPRMCLGKEMAYIQMKAVAASVIEGFDVEVVGEQGALDRREHQITMILKMKGGLPVTVSERCTAMK